MDGILDGSSTIQILDFHMGNETWFGAGNTEASSHGPAVVEDSRNVQSISMKKSLTEDDSLRQAVLATISEDDIEPPCDALPGTILAEQIFSDDSSTDTYGYTYQEEIRGDLPHREDISVSTGDSDSELPSHYSKLDEDLLFGLSDPYETYFRDTVEESFEAGDIEEGFTVNFTPSVEAQEQQMLLARRRRTARRRGKVRPIEWVLLIIAILYVLSSNRSEHALHQLGKEVLRRSGATSAISVGSEGKRRPLLRGLKSVNEGESDKFLDTRQNMVGVWLN